MGRFTRVAPDAMDSLQLDAGVILTSFDPADPVEPSGTDILAVTTGGIAITCAPTFSDFGEDVDNVPNNMMEFKHLDSWECSMSFSDLKFNKNNTRFALGAADITDGTGFSKITPRRDVKLTDFEDVLWWVGDKADGGAFAVALYNALSTGGVSIQTTKNNKGTNAVTLTGHVSINDQTTMPMDFFVIDPISGTSSVTYTAVVPVGTENPSEEGWYVLSGNRYILATDTTVDSNKTYYEIEEGD